MCAFVVLGLVFPYQAKRLGNIGNKITYFLVEWDIPQLSQSISLKCSFRPVFGRPFVGLPYAIGPLSCLSVMLVHCGQMVGRIKMKLGMQVGLIPWHIVLDGDLVPIPKKGAEPPPQFSAHVYCGHGRQSQLLLSSCKLSLKPKLL